ncbi:MAG: hypothetical protein HY719_09520 [Planctomycetes bacterium]|nr:hypothetical protein [Planctomycetota bacterium]
MPNALATIASYSNPIEAGIACSRLNAMGHLAFLENEYIVGVAPFLEQAVGGVLIRVRPEDADACREVLLQFKPCADQEGRAARLKDAADPTADPAVREA